MGIFEMTNYDKYAQIAADWFTLQDLLVDNAMDRWAVITPEESYTKTGEVAIRCEMSDRQLRDLYFVWCAWAKETGLGPPPPRDWSAYVVSRVHFGSIVPIIALDGDFPIGCIDCSYFIDPFTGKRTGSADHGFVGKEYRNTGVFKQMLDACELGIKVYECERIIIPVGLDDAAFLQPLYERHGFRHSVNVLERDEDQK